MLKGRFPIFSLATFNMWIFLSVETALNFDGCCHWWSNLHKYGVGNINNNNTCNNDGCSRKNTILRQTNIKRWFHSLCYWNIWVSSFSFWFIFYRLCIDYYRASLAIFFNLVNVYFSILIMCVHRPIMCASHNNFSMGHYTWLGFLISSTHYS
jgi:hypothetical protein